MQRSSRVKLVFNNCGPAKPVVTSLHKQNKHVGGTFYRHSWFVKCYPGQSQNWSRGMVEPYQAGFFDFGLSARSAQGGPVQIKVMQVCSSHFDKLLRDGVPLTPNIFSPAVTNWISRVFGEIIIPAYLPGLLQCERVIWSSEVLKDWLLVQFSQTVTAIAANSIPRNTLPPCLCRSPSKISKRCKSVAAFLTNFGRMAFHRLAFFSPAVTNWISRVFGETIISVIFAGAIGMWPSHLIECIPEGLTSHSVQSNSLCSKVHHSKIDIAAASSKEDAKVL